MAESPIISSMVLEPPDQEDKNSWDLFPWKDFPGYTQSQRCASTSSWIWQFGYDIEKSDDDTKRRWVCKVCVDSRRPNSHSAASSGTQNAEIHLWNDHKVCDPSGRRKPPSKAKEKTPSKNIAEMMKLNTRDAREQQIANQIIGRFDRLVFQRLVVSWIINSNSSFRQSEDPYLRAAFEYLNPLVNTTEAHITHNTVRRRILQVYEENKAEIKRALATAPGLLHIAFDGWRSNNRHALYGICCYFLNTLGQPGKLVLGLPELVDRHSGGNIAAHVVEVLRSYGITHKVGYFTLDNASNNDTAMEEIGKALGFEDSLTNLLRSLQLTAYSKSDDPVVRAKKPLDVIIDVVTRWLSTLYMIRRALLLKDFLEDLWYEQKSEWEGLVLRGKKSSSEMPLCLRDENKLAEKDWAIISLFNEVLQHFEHVLITLEGDGQQRKRKEGYIGAYGCLWDTLLGYEYLLGKMEVYKAAAHRYPDPEHFKVNINLCWKKLDKYYSRLDETPVYYAAIALHPAYRWGYFEDVWADRPDWIQTAKSLVEELYRSHYEPRIISRDRERGEPVTKKRRIYRNPFDEYREESRQAPTLLQPASSMTTLLQAEDAASSSTHAVGDEYSDWFRDVHKSDQNILDPISYWYERREEYPRLSQMALDVLSVLPMSADVERLFSTCGRMVRDDRARLDASTIGMTQTIKFNAKGRRIRCIAHIINLSLQAFLLASSKEALVAALESASGVTGEGLLSQFSEVLASHRRKAAAERNTAKRKNGEPARKHKRKGSTASNTSVISADDFSGVENVPALRKLHGLAVWLSSSSLHQNAWDKAVGLRLGMDNRTRWSSWYQVIDRAIRKKDKIQSFMSDHEEAIGDNRLLVGDWELLGKKIYQSDEHSDEQMVRAIDMGWFILSKYYRLTDEVPVYAAALLLDPRKRIVYIKQNWPKEWHEDTIASATAFWQKEFNYEQPSDHPSTPTSMPPPLAKKPNQLAILSKKLEVRTINASVRDNFTSFINVNATDIPPDYTPLE
ncbi:hypothetical protein Forpe1208_v003635 [Fusarium oxysporum f. sp. rapae]|uniref:HAT C-terminal dimerisation domain-containing protein n=1 Tax=Fusarium oxysporum f. sp. rapae TaxID=485398 RepID=A0A8J5PG81_FUSOX|nr:hypothetical protein Forpe1208_v003635 [Fusarium oxysporum f. sp. rapae]